MTSCRRGCDSGPRDRYQRSRGPTCFVSDATSACGPKAAFLSPFGSRGESETRRRTDTQSTTPVCECQRPTAVNATRSPLWEGSFHHTGGGRRRSGYPPNVVMSCRHPEASARHRRARSEGGCQLHYRVRRLFHRAASSSSRTHRRGPPRIHAGNFSDSGSMKLRIYLCRCFSICD